MAENGPAELYAKSTKDAGVVEGHKEVNHVSCARRRRDRLREGSPCIGNQLKIAWMRRDAVKRARHKGAAGAYGPAGEVSRFKSRVCNEICRGGMGKWESRSCGYGK